jgi:CHAT domain-containing protein
MEKAWESQYSEYLDRTFPDRTITPVEVVTTLNQVARQTGNRAAFIWVAPGEEELSLTMLTPEGDPVAAEVSVKERSLLRASQVFSREIANPTNFNSRQYLHIAQTLHRWLVKPLEEELTRHNIDTLIFCMGPGLRTLPVAALHNGEAFLIEDYNVALVPAFSLTQMEPEPLRDAQVLVMGASEFEDQTPLPAVPVEVETIAQDWQGSAFLNQEFTQANLRRQRQQRPFEIIHLATHADFQPGDLANSYIQLWDSRLTLDQIDQLNLESPLVELLVLSACRTAIGDREAELGFAGLAVQAGVRSAVASLWYVSDAGTLGLMTEFYRQLKTAPTKAAALRQAQIALLKGTVRIEEQQLLTMRGASPLPLDLALPSDNEFSHPYYWAAFTVVGNPW